MKASQHRLSDHAAYLEARSALWEREFLSTTAANRLRAAAASLRRAEAQIEESAAIAARLRVALDEKAVTVDALRNELNELHSFVFAPGAPA